MAIVIYLGYGALFTLTPETYPTEVRNSAQGFFFAVSRLGGMCAPLIAGRILDLPGGMHITLVMFLLAYLTASISAIFLKETKPKIVEENLLENS